MYLIVGNLTFISYAPSQNVFSVQGDCQWKRERSPFFLIRNKTEERAEREGISSNKIWKVEKKLKQKNVMW